MFTIIIFLTRNPVQVIGADPGFFLGGGAPLTDWWRKKF